MTKYNSKKTTIDGITFASRLEATRYQQLRMLEQAEEISALQLQVEFQILKGFINPDTGEKIRSKHYIADFVYYDEREHKWIAEDTKGQETDVFRLKWDYVRSIYGKQYEFRKVTRDMV